MGDVSDMRHRPLLGNESDKPRVRAEPDEPKALYASDCFKPEAAEPQNLTIIGHFNDLFH